MNEWEYLVAVVRGAFQSVSRGMAGAARGYKESAQMRPADAAGNDDGSSEDESATFYEDLFRRERKRRALDPAYNIYVGNAHHRD